MVEGCGERPAASGHLAGTHVLTWGIRCGPAAKNTAVLLCSQVVSARDWQGSGAKLSTKKNTVDFLLPLLTLGFQR